MKHCGFGALKYILLVASFGLGVQVAGEEKHFGEIYNAVINESVESHLWNITDFNDTIPHNSSLEYEGSYNRNQCYSGKCRNNGTCIVTYDKTSWFCICPRRFTGLFCQIERDLCDVYPCYHRGLCRIENGTRTCDCIRPYAGENCKIKCDCGDAICELDEDGSKKDCNCTEKQIPYEGKCVDCDCGNGTCRLDYRGKKKCLCRKDQAVHKGKCVDCNCGERSRGCFYDYLGGNKRCYCSPLSAHFEGACKDCNCGPNWLSCSFHENGTMNCHCSVGYTQRNNTCHKNCKKNIECYNGGTCRKEHDGYFCKCREGFSGQNCLTDDICNSMKDKCDAMGAVCIRSEEDLRLCECPDRKMYSWKSEMCENICDVRKCNYGTCEVIGNDYRCRCNRGFTGLNCDKIDYSIDIKLKTRILVILGAAIAVFFLATLCLIQRNKQLIKSLQQKTSIHEPRI